MGVNNFEEEMLTDERNSPRKTRVKYRCQCSNVWGKPSLDMTCNTCGALFKALSD